MTKSPTKETVSRRNKKLESKRVVVVFGRETRQKLDNLKRRRGTIATTALSNAISLTDYLQRAIEDDSKIFIERDGKTIELFLQ